MVDGVIRLLIHLELVKLTTYPNKTEIGLLHGKRRAINFISIQFFAYFRIFSNLFIDCQKTSPRIPTAELL